MHSTPSSTSDTKETDKVLTLQLRNRNLDPRTFKVPVRWIYVTSVLAWLLVLISIVASVYAVKEYYSERAARPELVKELENEIQELKITLEKRGNAPPVAAEKNPAANPQQVDSKAVNEKPAPAPGETLEGKTGVWTGLAANVSAPTEEATIRLEDPRVDWQGKYANFALNVVYKDPGKGSQQGHIVVLARANDRLFAHPEGVLNTPSGQYLFTPERGEFFSVARFRILKARFGPFDNTKQLSDIQVFVFDSNNKLILMQSYHYGK